MTATRLLLAFAGLMGAAGVALAALAAHAYAGTALVSASTLLMLHAPAVIALAVARKAGLVHDLAGRVAAWALALGASLFAAAVALPLIGGFRLFPMAAPAGGTLLIVAWLLAAMAALIGGERA